MRSAKILGPNIANPPYIFRQRNNSQLAVLLVEQKPQVKSIAWGVSGKLRKIYLAFPYIVSIFSFFEGKFNNFLLFYRSAPLSRSADILCYPNLPNVHPTGVVCLGNSNGLIALRKRMTRDPLVWQVRKILTYFWSESVFNSDLIEQHFLPWTRICPQLASLETWQRNTRCDPNFILEVNWSQRSAGSASELMELAPFI